MTKRLPDLVRAEWRRVEGPEDWIAWVRLLAAPFALLEVGIERGNYPPGHEAWGWTISSVFALGAVALFLAHRRGVGGSRGAVVALVFDTAVVSNYTALYAFEPGSPMRQLLFLVVIEAALRYGRLGAAWSLVSAPALALFEWRQANRLDLPFDPGHVLFPIGLQILVGLIFGTLTRRASEP